MQYYKHPQTLETRGYDQHLQSVLVADALRSGFVQLTAGQVDALTSDAATKAHLARVSQKTEKLKLLDEITVTTSKGNTFDGNETARNNMLSAISASDFLGRTTTLWRMANNTAVLVSVDEVREALALSIARAGEIYIDKA